ncbi:MAG: divergent polysaccharide deacetylase family protein [Alphaproteobacteria bacterium]
MKAQFAAFAAFSLVLLAASAFAWQEVQGADADLEPFLELSEVKQTPTITNTHAPEVAQTELPDWRRYAALSKDSGEAPIIALVIDDLGHTEREFTRVMALGEGITLAFLPYTKRVAEYAQRARKNGFEILVHMPMEPTDSAADPGPNALLINISESEMMRRLSDNLARLAGYVGINNHMGSKFSQNRRAMSLVLDELEVRGLLYLDSVTIGSTIGARLAEASRMPYASRDVFLDSLAEQSFIESQLRIVEKVARQSGHAVAIGHPYDETLEVLKRWLPDARKRGFEFVPISTIAALECAC